MRTDLTVRDVDGVDHDLAVMAPQHATLATVASAVAAAVPTARPQWCGHRRLGPRTRLGEAPLVDGAILTTSPSPPPTAGGTAIEIAAGDGAGRRFVLGGTDALLGRGAACDIVVADPLVSRRHVAVTRVGAAVLVRDLGTTHGTTLDGVTVTGAVAWPVGTVLRIGDTCLVLRHETAADSVPAHNRPPHDRPPHARQPLDSATSRLPQPPADRPRRATAWLVGALVPVGAAVAFATTAHSVLFLVLAVAAPGALVGVAATEFAMRHRRRRRARAEHARALAVVHAEVRARLADEVVRRRGRDPDPAEVARLATDDASRWARAPGPGFVTARVGLGRVPSAARVEVNGDERAAAVLADVPVTVDLAAGGLGLAGPGRTALARWVVVQLAVSCAPTDLQIAVITTTPSSWRWIRWLPHLARPVGVSSDSIDRLLAMVSARASPGAVASPHLLLVVDGVPGGPPTAARLEAAVDDARDGRLSVLCLAVHERSLELTCAQVVAAAGDTGCTVRLRGLAEASGETGVDVVADRVDGSWAETVARLVAPHRPRRGSHSLPAACVLADVLGIDATDAASLTERWSRPPSGLPITVGAARDGPLVLDLVRDGPHLLIAGTTGAGKSELLRTMILATAATQPPTRVTFLLIDYKGGAAFGGCADLPHTVGVLTDLDAAATQRALASLRAELRRRERVLADRSVRDLDDLHAAGGEMARLVVIVDEFATLAAELPALLSGLVGVAQRGRSLGLHLVLATQRPAGAVSAEIRANTAARICLRVVDAAESRDIVDDPGGVAIDPDRPGRALLRTGRSLVPFQTALAATRAVDDTVRVVPLDPWRTPVDAADDDDDRGGAAFVDAVVAAARAAAQQMPTPVRPWLPPLPDRVQPHDLPSDGIDGEQVAFGLLDLPDEQRRAPLCVDLATGAGVLVIGAPRTGRSTALWSLVTAAAGRWPPDRLHLYAVGADHAWLTRLAALPHAGTICNYIDSPDLAAELLARLTRLFAHRRDLQAGRASLPHLVVVVDGWDELVAAANEFDGGRTVDQLDGLIRGAGAAAAVVAVSAGRGALHPRLTTVLPTRLVLGLHDPADYAAAGVPRAAAPAEPVPGRGVRAGDGAHFQIAMPTTCDVAPAGQPAVGPDAPLRLRPLPRRITLDVLRTVDDRAARRPDRGTDRGVVLGVGGDDAGPVVVDLAQGPGRLFVLGPPGSGRSTVLRAVLAQLGRCDDVVVIAAPRSPLAREAARRRILVLDPDAARQAARLPTNGLLLVDDAEQVEDPALSAAGSGPLEQWLRDASGADRRAVLALPTDYVAVNIRGLAAVVRRDACGVLLQPGPLDAEVLGVRGRRRVASTVPGRGLLVPHPHWRLGRHPVPLQAVLHDEDDGDEPP